MPLAPFVRVRDVSTKHEFDVRADSVLIRDGRVVVVKGDKYPPSTIPRPPRHFIPATKLAPQTAVQPTPEPSGNGKPDTKES